MDNRCLNVRVIEIGTMVSGPLCGQILGDYGADVIKIETLDGDMMRHMAPHYKGASAAFAQYNRNKRSISLNLKTQAGIEIAKKLIATADVVILNTRPSVADSLGLDYESLSEANPGLIYASISGFGPSGPYRQQPAYDMVIQGFAGFMPVQGTGAEPAPIRTVVADLVVAYSAALAIMAALISRQASGGAGQKIDVPMLNAYAAFILPNTIQNYSFLAAEAPAPGGFGSNAYNVIKTKDGYGIGLILSNEHFSKACSVFGCDHLLGDPKYADPGLRARNQDSLINEIEKRSKELTTVEFLRLCHEHQLPFGPVYDIPALLDDPQSKHNEVFVEMDDPEIGRVRLLNSFARLSRTPAQMRSLAPGLGANTDEVLAALGVSHADIQAYREQKVIR
jgi:crotonobetainyl-CoA:carnitine CoA-transferase CaiB-like acyl-CoA transferase